MRKHKRPERWGGAPRVLVVGDVMTDTTVTPAGPLAHGSDTAATIRRHNGGQGANQAIWLTQEGIAATLAAVVGAEDLPRLKAHFAAFGVRTALSVSRDLPTGQTIAVIGAAGERSFYTDRGANDALGMAALPPSLLDGIDHLHVSGYALFAQAPRDGLVRVMRTARRREIGLSVDPSSHALLREAGGAFFEWTRGADLLTPNSDEAEALTGKREPEAQLRALAQHYPVIALKRGAEGAWLWQRGRITHQPAAAVPAIDTTGAGDAFAAALLAALLRGESGEQALAAAVARGSQAVVEPGAQPKARPREGHGVTAPGRAFGAHAHVGQFLDSYALTRQDREALYLRSLPLDQAMAYLQRRKPRDVVEFRATLLSFEGVETDGEGKHQRLLVRPTALIDVDPDVAADAERVLAHKETVFVAIRFGDRKGLAEPVPGLSPGGELHIRGEWVPRADAYQHGGEQMSVVHFVHYPVGFVCTPDACYR